MTAINYIKNKIHNFLIAEKLFYHNWSTNSRDSYIQNSKKFTISWNDNEMIHITFSYNHELIHYRNFTIYDGTRDVIIKLIKQFIDDCIGITTRYEVRGYLKMPE